MAIRFKSRTLCKLPKPLTIKPILMAYNINFSSNNKFCQKKEINKNLSNN